LYTIKHLRFEKVDKKGKKVVENLGIEDFSSQKEMIDALSKRVAYFEGQYLNL